MIPRTLVPLGSRLPAADVTATQRRRPVTGGAPRVGFIGLGDQGAGQRGGDRQKAAIDVGLELAHQPVRVVNGLAQQLREKQRSAV